MTGRVARLVAFAAIASACAPTLPRAYLEARAAAERAYGAGRYREAAEHWLVAARAADRTRDVEEARFRAAASFARSGATDRARKLYAQLAHDSGERAARAEYERIRLVRNSGDEQQANRDLRAFLRRYPGSGLATTALDQCLRWFEDHSTSDAELEWLDREIVVLGTTELGEALAYRRARLLDASGHTQQARDAYLALAARYPYPRGAYWDDALWYASLTDEHLGKYRRAIADLQKMLAAREPAYFQGSYNRPRFDDAQYRIAELYRDRLDDPDAARRAFHRVFVEFDTSRLRDDALWNEALLALPSDEKAACRLLATLTQALPDSRYVPCVPLVCGGRPPPKRVCHDYLRRELDAARTR